MISDGNRLGTHYNDDDERLEDHGCVPPPTHTHRIQFCLTDNDSWALL